MSFAEIKLKYENDFETPFTVNDKANSDEYSNIVENHDNAIKAQKEAAEKAEQKAQKEAAEKQKQKEQAEKEKRALAEKARKAQKALEAMIKNNSATVGAVSTVVGNLIGGAAATAEKAEFQKYVQKMKESSLVTR